MLEGLQRLEVPEGSRGRGALTPYRLTRTIAHDARVVEGRCSLFTWRALSARSIDICARARARSETGPADCSRSVHQGFPEPCREHPHERPLPIRVWNRRALTESTSSATPVPIDHPEEADAVAFVTFPCT